MNRALLVSIALLLATAPAMGALAKSSDRNQSTTIDAGHSNGNLEGNGKTVLSQGVLITQGSLKIESAAADVYMADGEIARAVFTGKQVKLRQQLDDGTWMDATADTVDYDLRKETLTMTGNYTVKTARGSNSGQRMTYNLKSGNVESGGDGSRVITVIPPKSAQPAQGKN